ncbi:hypothetical protein [Vreelandella aquamarina]|uniref:hypothetical protein n=1 Tax=Vreelandella aquamarina TaxID=77097 RepID=UPI00384B4585
MVETIEDFSAATEYERLVLNQLFPLFPDDAMGNTLDLREAIQGTGPAKHGMTAVIKMFADDRNLQGVLAPLAFSAAWKVIDLLIELALAQGGFQPGGQAGRWSISRKVQLAGQAPGDQLLGVDMEVWQAICFAYARTEEHRHCLIHRRASFTERPLRLAGKKQDGEPLLPLDEKELRAFVNIAQLLGTVVGEAPMPERTVGQLRFLLQQMSRHIGCEFAQSLPLGPVVSVFMCLQPDEGKGWLADFAYVHQKMDRSMPHYLADVWIDIPNESGYRLFGHLEQLPKDKIAIRLDALPDYLSLC